MLQGTRCKYVPGKADQDRNHGYPVSEVQVAGKRAEIVVKKLVIQNPDAEWRKAP